MSEDNDHNRYIAIDFETYPIQDRNPCPRPVCGAWYETDDRCGVELAEDFFDRLERWLADPAIHLIAHNASFDFTVLCEHAPHLVDLAFDAYEVGRIRCTLYREKLIELGTTGFIKRSFALDRVLKRRFDVDISEDKHGDDSWRCRYHHLDGIDVDRWPDAAVDYVLSDAFWTKHLFDAQRDRVVTDGHVVAGPSFVKDEHRTAATAFALDLFSAWGLAVDVDRGAEVAARLEDEVDEVFDELRMAGFYRADGSKNMAEIKSAVEAAYDGDPPVTNPDDPDSPSNVRTAKAVLEESGDPALEKLASISEAQKLLNTFSPVVTAPTVHPGYDALKASGRSSSFSPNIQNLPRSGGIRECFRARPGRAFVLCDYSSLELRSLAQACLDNPAVTQSQMAEVLRDGRDLHLALGAKILGVDYDTAESWYHGEEGPEAQKRASQARSVAKIPNFGIPGGMRLPETLQSHASGAYGMDLTLDECRDLVDNFERTWPGVMELFDWISRQCGFDGGMTVCQPRTGRVRADTRQTAAANSQFQGLAADGTRVASWKLARACYTDRDSPLFGSRPVAFVHDEYLVEVPLARYRRCAREVERIMCDGMATVVPDVPIEAEPAAAIRWYKSAEPVFDPSGGLELWVPHRIDDGEPVYTDPDAKREAEDALGRELCYATG